MNFKTANFFGKIAIIFAIADILLLIHGILVLPAVLWLVKGNPWWNLLFMATIPAYAFLMIAVTGSAEKKRK